MCYCDSLDVDYELNTSHVFRINAKLGGINFVPLGNGMQYIHNAKPEEAVMVVGAPLRKYDRRF